MVSVCYTGALGFKGVDPSTLKNQVTDIYLHKAALTSTFLQKESKQFEQGKKSLFT